MSKIVVLTASWCGPCKMLKPVVEQVSAEHPEVQVEYVDVDTDEGAELCGKFSVRGVPTCVVVDGDEVKKTRTGTMTKDEVVALFTQ